MSTINGNFLVDFRPEDDRLAEAKRMLDKYPNRVPVLVTRLKGSKIELIDREKYLVPRHLTMGEFVCVIRSRLKLPPEKAIFLFVNGVIPSITTSVSEVYECHKSNDNFLRVLYTEENVFG